MVSAKKKKTEIKPRLKQPKFFLLALLFHIKGLAKRNQPRKSRRKKIHKNKRGFNNFLDFGMALKNALHKGKTKKKTMFS